MQNELQSINFQMKVVSQDENLDVTLENVNNYVDTISGYFDNEIVDNQTLQQNLAMKTFETLAVNRQTLSFKKSKISIESEIDKFLSLSNL